MNTEQGMSKEEVRGPSEEMATKKRENPQRALRADVFKYLQSVILFVSCFFVPFRGDYPSAFDIPCSTFFGFRGGWRHRLVDGFAA